MIPIFFNLLRINAEIISHLEFLPSTITRTIPANRPIDHITDETRSNQSLVTEELLVKKTQPQTQTTSVISNPNINNIGTTESIPHTEVTDISPPTSFTLLENINIPLQVPKTIIRSKSDIQNYPNISEISASIDNRFHANIHHFQ